MADTGCLDPVYDLRVLTQCSVSTQEDCRHQSGRGWEGLKILSPKSIEKSASFSLETRLPRREAGTAAESFDWKLQLQLFSGQPLSTYELSAVGTTDHVFAPRMSVKRSSYTELPGPQIPF